MAAALTGAAMTAHDEFSEVAHHFLLVRIRVRQQCQVTSALDGGRQLTLILRLGTRDTARYDLSSFSDVLL
jgi:hypothetical protein